MIKRSTKRLFIIFCTVLLILAAGLPAQAAVIYVDSAATTGANNGSSWFDAYTELQTALGIAASNDSIWVAVGTYYPTTGADRYATFQLVNEVAVFGGFEGIETSLSHREWSRAAGPIRRQYSMALRSPRATPTGLGTIMVVVG